MNTHSKKRSAGKSACRKPGARFGLLAGLLLTALGSQVQGQIDSGLVSYWPLDEIQGTKTPDVKSFYDMELSNLTSDDVVPGKHGNAFSFSNERQTLLSRVHEAGDNLPANKHESHTISMWVNVEGEGQNDLRVFSEGNTSNSNPLFNIGTHNGGSDGTVDFYIRQSGWSTFGHAHSGQTAFDGTWHHVVWVQETDGSRMLYVDGVADELEIEPKPEGDWLLNDTSIGGILRASASHWVTGLIDDVAIWKRALSEDEVNSVGQNGVPSPSSGGGNRPPGLVAHWPLDEIQGTKTPDIVSGYDMDITNLTAADVVPGQNGNAFSFSNERQTLLSRVHEADEDLPANKHESHTITMWVNIEGQGQNDLRVFSEGNTENSNPLFNIGTHNGGSDGTVDFYIRQSGWSTYGHAHSGQTAFDSTWRHIAWVQDGGDRVLYVDGVADELEIEPKPEGDWLLNDTSIGGILRASASHWVTGLIDDVAIWKRALSEDEINSVIQNGVPKVTSGNLRPLGIASFDSEFSAVAGGGTAILTWDASADANLSINRGVGDVTAASEFGVGSVEVQVDASTTYTLTATRGNESTSATVFVTAYDGIEDGWSLIENFELREETSINGQHRWKNPEGTTAVVDTEGPFGKAMTLQGSALSALLLGSKTLKEGEKATLFYRVVGYDGDEPAIQCNVGLSEKPVRFIGDFDNDVGPFVQMSDIEGFGLDMYAINGFGEALDWTGSTVDYETVYNVWMDVTNLGLEEGDLFTVYFQDASGGDRTEAFKGYASDRNPAGSTDLGLPGPDLDTLFISSHNGALQANQFLVDDFYISSGGFNASVPTAPGGVSMIPEVDEPDVAGSISGIAVSDNKVVISFTGQLKSSDSVTGPYAPVAGASGDSYEVNPDQAQQFYIAE
jgi:hypothetical protein